jgi:glycosyltransferase involved in cell wall biosynthesis
VAADGVGNTIYEKVEASLIAGDRVQIFVEAGAPPVPENHRILTRHIDLATLLDERAGEWGAGFFENDVFLIQFLHSYPLMRASLLVDRGAVVFEWPGFTPMEHYRHEDYFRRLQGELDSILPLLDHCDKILVHSDSMGDEVRALRPSVADKITVLHPGVDHIRLTRKRPAARRGPGPQLVYVGRFAGNKRVDLLLQAFARFREENPTAHLTLVGNRVQPPYDKYGEEADALVRELGLGDSVTMDGLLSDGDLAARYQASDLMVTASLHEGFCLPAAEAMTCGVPVVGFATASLPQVVGPGGVLAEEVGDPEALARAMAEAMERRDELVEAARRQAEQFSRDAFHARFDALVSELAARRDEPRVVGRRHLLEALQETPIHYVDESDWPVIGPFFSALRRRMTLHFEKFFVRKMRRLQGLFNKLALAEILELRARVEELERAAGGDRGEEEE